MGRTKPQVPPRAKAAWKHAHTSVSATAIGSRPGKQAKAAPSVSLTFGFDWERLSLMPSHLGARAR